MEGKGEMVESWLKRRGRGFGIEGRGVKSIG